MAVIDHEELASQIKTALDHARDLKGTKIEVKISGTSVVLLGTYPRFHKRRQQKLWSVDSGYKR
jgi:hypothetical protein